MNTQKPTLVHVIAWTTLASGIVNIFWGFIASGTALATVIGIFCIPLTLLPTVLGVFELIYAAKLFSNPPQPLKPSTNIAVLEIACLLAGNLFSMAVGILSLVFYNDLVVKDYFTRLNSGTLEPAPVTPPAPASPPQPEVVPFDPAPPAGASQGQPAPEAPPSPREEPPAPPAEEPPAKPKRAPRKVAKK